MKRIANILIILCSITVTANATTAAKGVFSVAANKKVQFANATVATRAETKNLYQWSEVASLASAAGEGWDVLTGEEWSYLLASGRTNAADLNNLGTVNGKKGLIILPDGWVQPVGVPEYKPVDVEEDYSLNTYTAGEWELMAQSGAVFLPCGGNGHDDSGFVFDEDGWESHGAYWAKNEYNSTDANCMRFNLANIHDLNHQVKTAYYSVILVKEVTVPELYEEHEAAAFTTDLAAADDYNFAIVNRTMAKDSTLYTLCLPFDVPNVDASPLAGAEIFEFTGGHVSGTTGNEKLHLNMKRLDGKRLKRGTPYILRWLKSGDVQTITRLCFYNVENWDNNTTVDTVPGNTAVKLQGVYPQAAIPGYTSGSVAHYNFFLGANNTLYWPDDNTYSGHKMKGFRAYFYITPGGGPSPAPIKRGMQAVWEIGGTLETPTGIQNTEYNTRAEKFLRDGQIILVIDGKEYDLQGKKIKIK